MNHTEEKSPSMNHIEKKILRMNHTQVTSPITSPITSSVTSSVAIPAKNPVTGSLTNPDSPLFSARLRGLTDSQLIAQLKAAVLEERKQTALVLEYLREVDQRRLYADYGCSSLWEFCTRELGYSEASASRRISSMRLMREIPKLKDELIEGRQTLSSLSQAQRFFRMEQAVRSEQGLPPKLSVDQKREILEKLEGKSHRECEQELVKLSCAPSQIRYLEHKYQQERVIGEKHTELRLVLKDEVMVKLKRIQALRSHATPRMSYSELLEYMADEVLIRIDPIEKEKRAATRTRNLKSRSTLVAKSASASASEVARSFQEPPMSEIERPSDGPPTAEVVRSLEQSSIAGSARSGEQTFAVAVKRSPELPPTPEVVRPFKQPPAPEVQGAFARKKTFRPPIPAALRRAIWIRDQGQCGWMNPRSGKRCGSRYFLEIDHLKPVAHGGRNEIHLIGLRCRAHNARHAVQVFGAEAINQRRR